MKEDSLGKQLSPIKLNVKVARLLIGTNYISPTEQMNPITDKGQVQISCMVLFHIYYPPPPTHPHQHTHTRTHARTQTWNGSNLKNSNTREKCMA